MNNVRIADSMSVLHAPYAAGKRLAPGALLRRAALFTALTGPP
jgi:hypothetical protein